MKEFFKVWFWALAFSVLLCAVILGFTYVTYTMGYNDAKRDYVNVDKVNVPENDIVLYDPVDCVYEDMLAVILAADAYDYKAGTQVCIHIDEFMDLFGFIRDGKFDDGTE